MAYVVAADFRPDTVQAWTANLTLPQAEVSDAALTALIAAASNDIDRWTGDHFEPSTAEAVDVNGGNTRRLRLPRRCRSVTQVQLLGSDGSTYTTQASGAYTLVSSLDTAGTDFSPQSDEDYLIAQQTLSGTFSFYPTGWAFGNVWPRGIRNVRVTGNFDWAAVPLRIKDAVSLLVWDHFKEWNADMRRATRWSTNEASFERTVPTEARPSGIPGVDDIIQEFKFTRERATYVA